MILPILVLAQSLGYAPHAVANCGNSADAETRPRRSAAGFSVVVKMHSEDDHGKNTHLCMSDYSLVVNLPGAQSPQNYPLATIDDAWGRRMEFWVEGFSADGNRVITVISDGRQPALSIIVFDLRTNGLESLQVSRAFLRQLSAPCAHALHVSGTTADSVVLATEATGTCERARSWLVKPGGVVNGMEQPSIPETLADDRKVVPLDAGTAVEPNPALH